MKKKVLTKSLDIIAKYQPMLIFFNISKGFNVKGVVSTLSLQAVACEFNSHLMPTVCSIEFN